MPDAEIEAVVKVWLERVHHELHGVDDTGQIVIRRRRLQVVK